MDFADKIINCLPKYYGPETKEKIRKEFGKFFESRESDYEYQAFYTEETPDYLLQADMLNSVKIPLWSGDDFISGYLPTMLISNTCDISPENLRNANPKLALVAPIIEIENFLKGLMEDGINQDVIESLYKSIKAQEVSNIMYLPPNYKNNKAYIVFFDKINSVPINFLSSEREKITENRFLSLTTWAYYLFLVKTIYHFARIGAEDDGRPN